MLQQIKQRQLKITVPVYTDILYLVLYIWDALREI